MYNIQYYNMTDLLSKVTVPEVQATNPGFDFANFVWVALIGILAIGIFYMLLKAEMPDEDLEHCQDGE